MAYEESRVVISRAISSTSDFSTCQYRCVKLQSDGDAALQATAGGWVLGISQDAISTAGTAGKAALPICVFGVSKVWYASSTGSTVSVAIGDQLQCSTGSEVFTATTSDNVIGRALTAHSSGAARALGSMLVNEMGIY
jgi:hypothetical protein